MVVNTLVARFIGSRICSSLGDQVLMFAIPLIVYRYTNSVAMSGFAFFIEWLPRVISLPIAGTIADRLGGWRIYPIADGVRAVASVAAAVLVLRFPHDTFAVVTALIAVSAFLFSQINIATEVTVARLVDASSMPKAQSLLQAVDQSSYIAGPALAGVAVIWLPPVLLLWGIGVLFATSAVLAWTLRTALSTALAELPAHSPRHIFADLALGLRIVRETPVIMRLTAMGMTANLLVGFAFATSAALTVGKFGLSNSYYSVLQIVIGGMALITYAFVPYLIKRVSVFTIGIASYVAIVAGGLLMTVAPSFLVFAAGFAIASGLCGLFNVYVRTERIQWIPKEDLGKVIGVIALLNQATLPLSGLIVGLFAARLNVQILFGCAAALGALLCIAFVIPLQRTCKTAVFRPESAASSA